MHINLVLNNFVKSIQIVSSMKKFLFFIFIIAASAHFNAQTSAREISFASQKTDDGLMIVYPNPAKDFILLKSKDSSLKIKSVAFYSILGVQVAEYNINANTSELRLDRLKPGKYLLRYTLSDNTQKVTQIVKQ